MVRPDLAFSLTALELEKLAAKHGRRGARWRVNISDDLRHEILAPGLFAAGSSAGVGNRGFQFAGVRGYAYTKWSPSERPGRSDLRLVYSASERTSPEQIVAMCEAGHRVSVVMDVRIGAPLPTTWGGIPVVDGDLSDDLWKVPAGTIVGLRAKGSIKSRKRMNYLGFSFPAVAPLEPTSVPVTLGVRPAA